MISNAEDMLEHIEEDGVHSEILDGWLGYYVNSDKELVASFESAVNNRVVKGKWKLVPIDEQ